MKTIKDIVISALSFFNYHYNADDECVYFGVNGDNCSIKVNVLCKEEDELLIVHGTIPALVPKDKRSSVIDMMNEKNNYFKLTTLYLDSDDGQVMCRCAALDCEDALNEHVVKVMISTVIDTLDEVYPEIIRRSVGL